MRLSQLTLLCTPVLLAPLAILVACTPDRRGGNNNHGNKDGGGQCQGLECDIDACTGQSPTSVSGRVMSPSGQHPVHDALVYVPKSVEAFSPTVACESCSEPAGGVPLVRTNTAVDGTFKLDGIPTGASVPLVIQKGRFRRQLTIKTTSCQNVAVTDAQVRLPSTQSEGDLPKMAVGVGAYDQIECVLRSIGIAGAEFTDPNGSGAVHLFHNGAGSTSPYPPLEDLLGSPTELEKYNVVFINCTDHRWQDIVDKPGVAANIADYVGKGGRLYVTDLSYDYIEQVNELAPYIYYYGGGSMTAPQGMGKAIGGFDISDINATVSDPTLASWLEAAGEANGDKITVTDLAFGWALIDSVSLESQSWVHGQTNGADRPLSVTFDYNACGRVLYSSYHTREPGGSDLYSVKPFPQYCQSSPTTMIAQEKILEYLIFHISSCVGPIG